jgi:hypothetical protein
MKPREEDFKKAMFDIKVDLDEISLNINRDQVKLKNKNYLYIFESFSIRIYLIYLNFKIISVLNQNI